MRIAHDAHSRYATWALALAATLGVATPGLAFNPQPEPPAFGMTGLGRYQTAMVTAVLTHPPDPDHPGCGVLLAFVDGSGNVIRDRAGNAFVKKVVLRGNVASSLALRAEDILADGETRKSIRAVVTDIPPDPQVPTECGGMVATLELVAPNGWTTLLETLAVPPPPRPEPPDPS